MRKEIVKVKELETLLKENGEFIKETLNLSKEPNKYIKSSIDLKNNKFDRFVVNLLFELVYKQFPKEYKFTQLIKAGIGGRVCYSHNDIETLLTQDKRLNSYTELINYLDKLFNLKHLSVFRHSTFIVRKEKEFKEFLINNPQILLKYPFTLIDVFRTIFEIEKDKFSSEKIGNLILRNFGYLVSITLEDIERFNTILLPILNRFSYKDENSLKEFKENILRENYLNILDIYFDLVLLWINSKFYTPYIGGNGKSFGVNYQHLIEIVNYFREKDTNLKELTDNVEILKELKERIGEDNFKENLTIELISGILYEPVIENNLGDLEVIRETYLNELYKDFYQNKFLSSQVKKYEILYNEDFEDKTSIKVWVIDKVIETKFMGGKIEIDLENSFISFIVEDTSRVMSHQIVRHTLYSGISQRSQRYVNESKDVNLNNNDNDVKELVLKKFVIPYISDNVLTKLIETLDNEKDNNLLKNATNNITNKPKRRGRPPKNKEQTQIEQSTNNTNNENEISITETLTELDQIKEKIYNEFIETYELVFDKYKELIEKYKVNKEDARFLLPNGTHTTIFLTYFGRGLENLITERFSPKAQWEIRYVITTLIKDILEELSFSKG